MTFIQYWSVVIHTSGKHFSYTDYDIRSEYMGYLAAHKLFERGNDGKRGFRRNS